MIIGDQHRFAIESEIEELTENGWLLGHFRFWVLGEPVGNWDDYTDLKGCAYWLRNFIDVLEDRNESDLVGKSKEEVFRLLYDSVMGSGEQSNVEPPFEHILSRFHISHLGMSSFDRFDILLIETDTQQHLLWRSADDLEIKEAWLSAGEMQRIAERFYQWFKAQEKIIVHKA